MAHLSSSISTNRRYQAAATQLLERPLFMKSPDDMEVFQESRPIFVSEDVVTQANVEEWAQQLLVLLASGGTSEFLYCVPLQYSNRVMVKIIARSMDVRACVTQKSIIFYYGSRQQKFSDLFNVYGVIL